MATFWPVSLVEYAEIVSAVGTAAAVITSLYLASRSPKPKLQVEADHCMIIGVVDTNPSFMRIRVTNVGSVDALLTGVSWKVRRRWPWQKDRWGYQDVSTTTPYHQNPRLPVRLAHGEQTTFLMETHGKYNWFEHIEEKGMFPESLTSLKELGRLRVVAGTSISSSEGKPDEALKKMIWAANSRYLEMQSPGA